MRKRSITDEYTKDVIISQLTFFCQTVRSSVLSFTTHTSPGGIMSLRRIVVTGIQGSGKTTQGEILAKHFSLPHFSTGNLIRREMQMATAFGMRVQETMNAGGMLDDNDVNQLLMSTLETATKGWVLDGYPRRVSQAATLMQQHPPTKVIELYLTEEFALRRLQERQREDDQEATIRNRIALYNKDTVPAIHWLRDRGVAHSMIRAELPIEEVTEAILWQLHFQ
jgi:adenylate kinase